MSYQEICQIGLMIDFRALLLTVFELWLISLLPGGEKDFIGRAA
jgi:hypothetical protein